MGRTLRASRRCWRGISHDFHHGLLALGPVRTPSPRRQRRRGLSLVGPGRRCRRTRRPTMPDSLALGFFIQPVHPPARPYADVLREDREAVVLADRLGY